MIGRAEKRVERGYWKDGLSGWAERIGWVDKWVDKMMHTSEESE